MSRPKKNEAEQPLILNGDKLPVGEKKAAKSANNAAETENNEIESPIETENWAKVAVGSSDLMSFLIFASNDIEARQGRMEVQTGIIIKDGYRGLIFPIYDNAAHGLKTEADYRLQHSDVIPMQASQKVKLVLNIADETLVHEQTAFGSHARNLRIPKGTLLAELVLFKL